VQTFKRAGAWKLPGDQDAATLMLDRFVLRALCVDFHEQHDRFT
jgi:hypothetical protein